MTHEWEWNNNDPLDTHKAGLGAAEIQETRSAIFERMNVDHHMGGVLLPSSDQDGTHNVVTLKAKSSTPIPISGAGKVYAKNFTVGGITTPELCYLDELGNEIKITEQGTLSFLAPRRLVVSGSTSVTLTSSYSNPIPFSTVQTRVPTELIWSDNTIFSCDLAGVYFISVLCNSTLALSLAIYKNNTFYMGWSMKADEGYNNRFAFVDLAKDDTIRIKGKSDTPSSAVISTRSLQIIKI